MRNFIRISLLVIGMIASGGVMAQTPLSPSIFNLDTYITRLAIQHGADEFKIAVYTTPAITLVPDTSRTNLVADAKAILFSLFEMKKKPVAEAKPVTPKKKGVLAFLWKEQSAEVAAASKKPAEKSVDLKEVVVKGTGVERIKPLFMNVPATVQLNDGAAVLVIKIAEPDRWIITSIRGTIQAYHDVVGEMRPAEFTMEAGATFAFQDKLGGKLEIYYMGSKKL